MNMSTSAPSDAGETASVQVLAEFIMRHSPLLVLTGAGISTASGIPGYRDANGNWQRRQPVTHQEFTGSEQVRKRYWARSMTGWPVIDNAVPNPAHAALAQLEAAGRITRLVTQNVDSLHQRAGSRNVIDLHGRLREVVCLDCGAPHERAAVQRQLESANPDFLALEAGIAPDGDADIEGDFSDFVAPACPSCGGMLKPDVVFYGGSVPRARADAAHDAVLGSEALLVVGSSLMVRSSFRLCEAAAAATKPIAAINLGRTRADHLFAFKLEADCTAALTHLAARC